MQYFLVHFAQLVLSLVKHRETFAVTLSEVSFYFTLNGTTDLDFACLDEQSGEFPGLLDGGPTDDGPLIGQEQHLVHGPEVTCQTLLLVVGDVDSEELMRGHRAQHTALHTGAEETGLQRRNLHNE